MASFFADQKRNFSFKKGKKKQKNKKKENFDPGFDWGLALNPIAFIHSHAKFIIY